MADTGYLFWLGSWFRRCVNLLSLLCEDDHFVFTVDHGVPLHALPLVSFVRNSAAANTQDAGPIVVHCR